MSSTRTSEPVNIELLLPSDDEPRSEVSIFASALNEELTAGPGLALAGILGTAPLALTDSHLLQGFLGTHLAIVALSQRGSDLFTVARRSPDPA